MEEMNERSMEIEAAETNGALYHPKVKLTRFYQGLSHLSRFKPPWKPGNKSDRLRINRYRSWEKRYHPALDVPEIFDKIMEYVDYEDPKGAIHFCRALETLGSDENLEYHYLQCKKSTRFSNRISEGAARVKILNGKHCVDCLSVIKTKISTDIGFGSRCWHCLSSKYGSFMPEKMARRYLEGAQICKEEIESLLGCTVCYVKRNQCGSKNHKGRLRRARHCGQNWFLKKDVKRSVRKWKSKEGN